MGGFERVCGDLGQAGRECPLSPSCYPFVPFRALLS